MRELEKIKRYHEQVHQIADTYDTAHALATDLSTCRKTQIKHYASAMTRLPELELSYCSPRSKSKNNCWHL